MLLLAGCTVTPEEVDAAAGEATKAAESFSKSSTQTHENHEDGSGVTHVGSAPELLNVSAALDGLTATWTLRAEDADNDTLTWSMDFGDNATANGTFERAPEVDESVTPTGNSSLQAVVNHTYALAGTYNVTVVISDGTDAVNQTLELIVAEAAPPAVPMDPLTFTGSCTTGAAETVQHTFDVTPGQARIYATITIGGGGVDIDWYLLDPAGSEKASGTSFTVRGENPLETASPIAGTWTFEVACFLGAAASYTINAEFT